MRGLKMPFPNKKENENKAITKIYLKHLKKDNPEVIEALIVNFLEWYHGDPDPMRFETDNDDVAKMFIDEGL
jgi:hypothetical protein